MKKITRDYKKQQVDLKKMQVQLLELKLWREKASAGKLNSS